MKTFISALFTAAILLIFSSAYAVDADKNCLRGDAKTIDDAFSLGVELAQKAGFELGDGEKEARIHILPDKEHGLYLVEVCPAVKEAKTKA